MIHRTPVGYHADFLDGYVPDRTFSLLESARVHLEKIGASHEQGLAPDRFSGGS